MPPKMWWQPSRPCGVRLDDSVCAQIQLPPPGGGNIGGGVSMKALMMKLNTAMKMLAKKAVQNPETENPRTK